MRAPRLLDEMYRVAWGDLCYFKDHAPTILLSCLVGPLLYLVAFGYGLGNGMSEGVDNYLAFIIPGIIAMATLSATFSFISSKMLIQKLFYSSLDELMLCPIKTSSIVLGKSVIGIIRGMLSCTIILIVGSFISGEISISPILFVIIFISTMTFSLLGILAGLLARKHNELTVFTSLVIVPMTFLSGTIFKISDVPDAIGAIIYAMPLTHPTETIRATMLGTEFPWISMVVMIVYCVAFFVLNYYIIRCHKY